MPDFSPRVVPFFRHIRIPSNRLTGAQDVVYTESFLSPGVANFWAIRMGWSRFSRRHILPRIELSGLDIAAYTEIAGQLDDPGPSLLGCSHTRGALQYSGLLFVALSLIVLNHVIIAATATHPNQNKP